MILPRVLAPSVEPCCLPTPHRISHYVAGMAFNFSKIEMAHQAGQRKPQQQASNTTWMRSPGEGA